MRDGDDGGKCFMVGITHIFEGFDMENESMGSDIELLRSGLLGLFGQAKVLCSEIRALVSLLPKDQQVEWLRIHKANCQRMRIDPTTGVSIDTQTFEEAGLTGRRS